MSATESGDVTPTVVLVHGAFADGSSWDGVIERLQEGGIPVIAPANPLRGISSDSAYVSAVLGEISGPVVVVGHSYGGAVISNAAAQAQNVVALVFVAAFAPEEGERLGEVTASSKDAVLGSALIPHRVPGVHGGDITEFTVDSGKFHDVFAADLSPAEAAGMAAKQRPVAEAAFSEPSVGAAWKHVPSFAVVATGDKAAGTDVTRSMAERAGARITELDGSHVIMVSRPQEVTDVIREAIAASSSAPAWAAELVQSSGGK